jgi:hypothetical protein
VRDVGHHLEHAVAGQIELDDHVPAAGQPARAADEHAAAREVLGELAHEVGGDLVPDREEHAVAGRRAPHRLESSARDKATPTLPRS